jgi:hypothetical protein
MVIIENGKETGQPLQTPGSAFGEAGTDPQSALSAQGYSAVGRAGQPE